MPKSKWPTGSPPSAESYRQKALSLCAAAAKTNDSLIRAEIESLAFAYTQLAEKAERTAKVADRNEGGVEPENG